jgi:hypothetical protein
MGETGTFFKPQAGLSLPPTFEPSQKRLANDAAQVRKEIAQLRNAGGVPPAGVPVTAAPAVPANPNALVPPAQPTPVAIGEKRGREKQIVLNQELRAILAVLHNEVQQARAATDRMVAQVELLRVQERQRRAQLKVGEELKGGSSRGVQGRTRRDANRAEGQVDPT